MLCNLPIACVRWWLRPFQTEMALLQIAEPAAAEVARRNVAGIDLGTTHSLIAVVRDGKTEVLADSHGHRLLPSVVRYLPSGEAVVGEHPDVAAGQTGDTLTSTKRFMGRGSADVESAQRRGLGAPLVAGEGMLRFATEAGERSPVQLAAEILRVLSERAATATGRPIDAVVITVPAYFDDAQRQATADAARLAGVELLRLISEPTAAALSYGLDRGVSGLIAVYDLGGGTFDISLLKLHDGVFQVLATGGDTALGGDDLDRAVAELLSARADIDPQQLAESEYRRLVAEARRLREQLSDTEEVAASFGNWRGQISRSALEAAIAPWIERSLKVCRNCLRDAELDSSDVQQLVLAGGATRTPLVRRKVGELFGCEPLCELDPDQVVVMGAARQAEHLAGNQSGEEMLLLDVLPLSLGIELMGGLLERIIPRNTPIPAHFMREFTTARDGQTAIAVHVLQGERELVADCRSLARFELRGIPPMTAGAARVQVDFRVDADGLLRVSAKEQSTGVESHVEVRPSYGISEEQIAAMLREAFEHAGEDRDRRALEERRRDGRQLLESLQAALHSDGRVLLSAQEYTELELSMQGLADTLSAGDPATIEAAVASLDEASRPFAERRMDAAVKRALLGRSSSELQV